MLIRVKPSKNILRQKFTSDRYIQYFQRWSRVIVKLYEKREKPVFLSLPISNTARVESNLDKHNSTSRYPIATSRHIKRQKRMSVLFHLSKFKGIPRRWKVDRFFFF